MPVATRPEARPWAAKQRNLSRRVVGALGRLWASVVLSDLEASWASRIPAGVKLLSSGQRVAASGAQDYVSLLVEEQGGVSNPVGELVPDAFAGFASDGRPLESLLANPVIATRVAQARGADDREALQSGLLSLSMLTQTQIADAGRAATGAAMVADTSVAGYERHVNLPACGRCILLAGRLYRWNDGFLRHPRCDCTHVPVTWEQHRTENMEQTPDRLFESMSHEEQDKAFTKAGAEAIRDGADVSQVVNARSGMKTAQSGVQVTTAGATRRGLAGQRLGAGRGQRATRLMPESIYELASDREEAIELLRRHGYIR